MQDQTSSPFTGDQAIEALVLEGFRRADVAAGIDTAIDAGLVLPQPDDDTILTQDEVDQVREELASRAWDEDGDDAGPARTFRVEEIALDDISATDLRAAAEDHTGEVAAYRIWVGDDAQPAQAVILQSIADPSFGNLGIAWGADADWGWVDHTLSLIHI